MALPKPEAGLVIRYNFLWSRDAEKGKINAEARPACIVVALAGTNILVLPISHAPPLADTNAIEIPERVRQHLGLDKERSWVVLDEYNIDTWPSADLSKVPRTSRYHYGALPPKFFARIRDDFARLAGSRRVKSVDRVPR